MLRDAIRTRQVLKASFLNRQTSSVLTEASCGEFCSLCWTKNLAQRQRVDIIVWTCLSTSEIPFIKMSWHSLTKLWQKFQQVKKRFGEDLIPLLDPVDDMKINEKPFKEIVKKISAFEARLTRLLSSLNKRVKCVQRTYGICTKIVK